MILKLLYIGLTVAMTLVLIFFGVKAIRSSVQETRKQNRYVFILTTGIAFWHMYTYLLSSNKVLYDFGFPPKFALLLILPLFAFTGVFFYLNRKKKWIHVIPLKTLTFIQSFRIAVEIIFVLTVSEGILHTEVTLKGYNYDFYFGISALIIGLLFIKNKISITAIKLWNYSGLAVLASVIFLFISTIYWPQLYGYDTTPAPLELTLYPYVLIAGFLMPLAVFFHIWSIVQINNRQ